MEKDPEEIKRYISTFMKRFVEIPNGDRIIKNMERTQRVKLEKLEF